MKVEGERDHSSSKHDVDYKRKRDSESGSRQSDDTVYRPAKRLSGIEISQRTAGRFEGRDLRPLLDSGSQGKEPRQDDTGNTFIVLGVEWIIVVFMHVFRLEFRGYNIFLVSDRATYSRY